MPNFLDYLAWRGDLTFSHSPFNEVDNLILAQLAYIDYSDFVSDVVPSHGVLFALASQQLLSLSKEALAARLGVSKEENLKLLIAASRSIRFGTMRLLAYESETDVSRSIQFAAISTYLSDGTLNICMRGTDNTLVGWKEDLNMSYLCPVPAQERGVEYLTRIAQGSEEPLRVLGHSKGGNLAFYAAAFCDESIQQRILNVYSNDGPGLLEDRLDAEGYLRIKDRLSLFIPQTSIVGTLLAHDASYTVVRSTAIGVLQHLPHTWQVIGARFVTEERPDAASRYINRTVDMWLKSTSPEKRELFIGALFELLNSTNVRTINELAAHWRSSSVSIASSLVNMDGPTRQVLIEVMKLLASSAIRNLPPIVQQSEKQAALKDAQLDEKADA